MIFSCHRNPKYLALNFWGISSLPSASTLFFLLLLFNFTPPALTRIYYVSPDGSGTICTNRNPCSLSYYQADDYTGTKHINLAPGDILYLKSGTYTRRARLDFSSSGTVDNRIIISTAPGEPTKAVISGDINKNKTVDEVDGPRALDSAIYHQWTPLVRVGGSYVTFRDIEIAFSGGRGIQSEGSYNNIQGLNVHHTWNNAIHVFGSNTLVEHNIIWRGAESNYCGGLGGYKRCNGDWPGALVWGESGGAVSPGMANHITVRGNTVYNNSGEGILCMHTDYSVVENNVVYDNWGLGIDIDKCGYATVQKNFIYYTDNKNWWRTTDTSGNPIRPASGILISNEYTLDSGNTYPLGHDRKIINNIIVGAGSGITFWPGDGSGGEFDRSRLINDVIAYNTIVEAQNNGTGVTVMQPPLAGLSHFNTRIVNNIILQSSGTMANVDTAAGLIFEHNLWSRTPSTNVRGVGDIYADPQLVNPNHIRIAGLVKSSWYKLSASSPAINTGITLTDINMDYWNNPRYSPVDVGAHEYSVSTKK
jgi:parallel beta-helix repeat protein